MADRAVAAAGPAVVAEGCTGDVVSAGKRPVVVDRASSAVGSTDSAWEPAVPWVAVPVPLASLASVDTSRLLSASQLSPAHFGPFLCPYIHQSTSRM